MKNLLLPFCLLVSFLSFSQVTYFDDFESYNLADPIAQTSPHWNSWAELTAPGTLPPFADDIVISNTMASSGDYSLHLIDATGSGGPGDILLMFDTTQNIAPGMTLGTPYTTGTFHFSQKIYVKSGATAYFNFQAENTPAVMWALEVQLDANGGITMSNQGGTSFNCTYPIATWFDIEFIIDLTNNVWEVLIDGVSQGAFSNAYNQVASLNLYPYTGAEYYIDDVYYSYDTTQIVLDSLDLAVSNVVALNGLDGQLRNPTVEVINLGSTPITSFDIDFSYNGASISETVTGVYITTVGTYSVNFTNNITLLGGANPCIATISNINGAPQDNNPANNTLTSQIQAVTPAPNKLVIGEEATGTWCGWCPRGAVALNWMEEDYYGYFQGIAVHNNDPMGDQFLQPLAYTYDVGLSPYISGYPSALVDRGADIDPSDFSIDFMQRVAEMPSVTITAGATQTSDSIKISLTLDFLKPINGNLSLACVLIEDSVTGQGPDWYQANSYSGGANLIDVDGSNWNTKPSNVPDYLMVYRHVARAIAPTFNGAPLSMPTYNTGMTETLCFEFRINPTWDLSKMHIVGMFIDNSGRIDNASSTTIDQASTNGYSSFCSTTTQAINLEGPENANTQLYPNPTANEINITQLPKNTKEISVINTEGKRIMFFEKPINKINIQKIKKGAYQLQIKTSNGIINRTFIKE
tara:strand:+ start:3289 stop:5370 length:2082 start_codon:yes stop_codon:yes gene_type:complete